MNRTTSALLFIALGAGGASIIWWVARPSDESLMSIREVRKIERLVIDVQDSVAKLTKEVQRQERSAPSSLPAPLNPRSLVERESNDQIVARLTAIEASLARIAEQQSSAPAPSRVKPVQFEPPVLPPPKAKDQTLVNDLLAKGAKEPGANTKTYFGLTPREIQQTFGKPDHTKWQTDAGHHDWFYYDANGATALQVRFEGGVVVGVYP